MRKYSENGRAPCAKIRGRGRAPKITKNLFGCDFLNYNLRLSIRLFLNRKIFLRADASSSGHFFREWCWSLTQKLYHYRIGDPTVLSGGWLGVRQVSRCVFAFFHLCLVVAFRKPEEFLVRKGRTLCFRTSCRQG
jgi:hypothetical protein